MKVLKGPTTKRQIKKHLSAQFEEHTGYQLKIDEPRTFNEKMQWLKLHYRDPLITKCSDKHAVRDYVEQAIGKKHLIELLGVWDRVADIDFDSLPKKFILKSNNGSGTNIICHDKSKLDIHSVKKQLEQWLNPESSHYYFSFEWGYKGVKPKIVCEKLVESEKGLTDYKFFCFHGQPKLLSVASNRQEDLSLDFLDLNWNKLPFTRHFKNSARKPKQPDNFDDMVKLARKLAKPFPFVRVDLYEDKDQILFGELTFYPGAGLTAFDPVDADYQLGAMLQLPEQPRFRRRLRELPQLIPLKSFSYSD